MDNNFVKELRRINEDMADDIKLEAKKFSASIEKHIYPFIEEVEGGSVSFSSVIEDPNTIQDTIDYINRVAKRIVWKAVEIRNLGSLSKIESFGRGWLTIAVVLRDLGFESAAQILQEENIIKRLEAIAATRSGKTRKPR